MGIINVMHFINDTALSFLARLTFHPPTLVGGGIINVIRKFIL